MAEKGKRRPLECIKMNLAILRRSRKRRAAGDIFAMLPPDGVFLYGRLIDPHANIGPMKDVNLIYIYKARSKEKLLIPIPELRPEGLLIPPIMVNNSPWTGGYFETIRQEPLRPEDRLPQHCFQGSMRWPGDAPRYFDEHSNRLPRPVEPVGVWGLGCDAVIDEQVSVALGIPWSLSTHAAGRDEEGQ